MRNEGIYLRYLKRLVDIFCALAALIVFSWLYIIIALLVRIRLGSPVLFTQPRPGKDEKIFTMYKFRTMTDERDADGRLLPDEQRMTAFGRWLRGSSLDEIPEALNILKGDMSVIGPRPQLVRDMVFMSREQRRRHSVRPGLSGWAQVNGRNALKWENKLRYDLEYIDGGITFWKDAKIVLMTVKNAFFSQEGITEDGLETTEDFGDYLLRAGKITKEEYDRKQAEAAALLKNGHQDKSAAR